MCDDKPLSPEKLVSEVRRLYTNGLWLEDGHGRYSNDRHPERVERGHLEYVLGKSGACIRKPEWSKDKATWKYTLEGMTLDGFKVRVVVYIKREPPLPDSWLYVLTYYRI